MGAFQKLIDATLFLYFLFISVIAPLIDAQTCLPHHLFPSTLVELKTWYAREYNDYLVNEMPHFFVGSVLLEVLFQWPLAVACVYGIASGKSWVGNTCLIYGVSAFTSMVVILAELTLSNRASDQLLTIYFPFAGFAFLAFLRGLLTQSGNSTTVGKRAPQSRKKRA